MKIRKLLPLLIVLALAVMLVGCASTNEPTDALSPTVPAVTVPAATEPAATAPAAAMLLKTCALPGRFPPEIVWILLSALPVCAVVLLAAGLNRLPRAAEPVRATLAHLGAGSLYYLLTSNLAIFALAGRGIVPQYSKKGLPPFSLTIQSPEGALGWAALLLLAIWFVSRLANRGKTAAGANK